MDLISLTLLISLVDGYCEMLSLNSIDEFVVGAEED
jgi:hypothetical protein